MLQIQDYSSSNVLQQLMVSLIHKSFYKYQKFESKRDKSNFKFVFRNICILIFHSSACYSDKPTTCCFPSGINIFHQFTLHIIERIELFKVLHGSSHQGLLRINTIQMKKCSFSYIILLKHYSISFSTANSNSTVLTDTFLQCMDSKSYRIYLLMQQHVHLACSTGPNGVIRFKLLSKVRIKDSSQLRLFALLDPNYLKFHKVLLVCKW